MDGITIGDGVIIGTKALITKNIEPYSIIGGVPGKVLRKRFSEEEIRFLIDFKWWDKNEKWIIENFIPIQNFSFLCTNLCHMTTN